MSTRFPSSSNVFINSLLTVPSVSPSINFGNGSRSGPIPGLVRIQVREPYAIEHLNNNYGGLNTRLGTNFGLK